MIRLTRLNQSPLVLNSDLIEHIEMTPDTVISLTTGQKLMVRETPEQITEKVIHFRRAVLGGFSAYNWRPRQVGDPSGSPQSGSTSHGE